MLCDEMLITLTVIGSSYTLFLSLIPDVSFNIISRNLSSLMKITIISFSSAMSEMLQRELMAYFDLEAL
jgi:hypothetical protein